jgi:hypothetical protein
MRPALQANGPHQGFNRTGFVLMGINATGIRDEGSMH